MPPGSASRDLNRMFKETPARLVGLPIRYAARLERPDAAFAQRPPPFESGCSSVAGKGLRLPASPQGCHGEDTRTEQEQRAGLRSRIAEWKVHSQDRVARAAFAVHQLEREVA